jgi:hypothetical protein
VTGVCPRTAGSGWRPSRRTRGSRRRIPLSASRSVPRDRGAAILRLADRPAGALPEPGTTSPLARHTPSPGHGRGLRPAYIKNCPPGGRFGPLNRRSHTRKSSLSWSPLTESNRRPSPYHGSPEGSVSAGSRLEQQEREHRPAPIRLGQALTSRVCHSICHSV